MLKPALTSDATQCTHMTAQSYNAIHPRTKRASKTVVHPSTTSAYNRQRKSVVELEKEAGEPRAGTDFLLFHDIEKCVMMTSSRSRQKL
jgi:hypothetical protein